jgi:hypothetical protein
VIVSDFGGDHSVHSVAQLEQRLGVRFQDEQNLFYLTPDSSDYPALTVHVRGDPAAIYYYRGGGQGLYVSVGGKMNLNPKEWTTFSIDRADSDPIDVFNVSIVPFSEALEAAKEFFHSQELPRSIEWRQL